MLLVYEVSVIEVHLRVPPLTVTLFCSPSNGKQEPNGVPNRCI